MDFRLNGNLAELRRLVTETNQFCQENQLGGDVSFDLNLALEELFTNTLRHGGCEGMEDAVHIHMGLQDGSVVVEFSDRGPAFDPSAAPAPNLTAPLGERPVGGLGIHLVRQIMRDLRYQRSAEWNRVTMRRPVSEAEST